MTEMKHCLRLYRMISACTIEAAIVVVTTLYIACFPHGSWHNCNGCFLHSLPSFYRNLVTDAQSEYNDDELLFFENEDAGMLSVSCSLFQIMIAASMLLIWIEWRYMYAQRRRKLYNQRPRSSSGLALGSMSVPWIIGSIFFHNLFPSERALAEKNNMVMLGALLALSLCFSLSMTVGMLLQIITNSISGNKNSFSKEEAHCSEKRQASQMPSVWKDGLLLAVSLSLLTQCFGLCSEMISRRTSVDIFQVLIGCISICALVTMLVHSLVSNLGTSLTLGEAILLLNGLFSSLAIPVILRLEGKEALYWHDSMVLYTVSMSTFMGIITGSLLRNRYRLTSLLLGTIFMMLMSPIIAQVVVFAFATSQRLMVLVWWMGLLIVLLPMIHLISKSKVVPNIIVRKGYHALAVALFLPALLIEPRLLGNCLALAWMLLVVLEVFRVGNVPIIGTAVQAFMSQFIDNRDEGVVYVTHFSLLLGLAGPIWISNAMDRNSIVPTCALAGILITGVGDAAASIFGTLNGRTKLVRDVQKTVEGTAAGAIATLAAWLILQATGSLNGFVDSTWWFKLTLVTCLSCLLEACTSQLDNFVVPLHYFALLRSALA